MGSRKREGDGATPAGRYRLVEVRYRADRQRRPRTGLALRVAKPDDGWCDQPGDRNYNRPVRLPYRARAEHMWRDDGLYDVVVLLDHNRRPRVAGLGSAIFLHVARDDFGSTEGCIALRGPDLIRLLSWLGRKAYVKIGAM